jgi:hypothetical protein
MPGNKTPAEKTSDKETNEDTALKTNKLEKKKEDLPQHQPNRLSP